MNTTTTNRWEKATRRPLTHAFPHTAPPPPPSILNKLTVEKFSLLSRQLLSLGLHSETILKGVIALIFHKAIHEPQFAELYARVSRHPPARPAKPGALQQPSVRSTLLTPNPPFPPFPAPHRPATACRTMHPTLST